MTPSSNTTEVVHLGIAQNFIILFLSKKYFHKVVDCHVRYTHLLHKLSPKKFSIATPKKGTSDYLWIFDPIDGIAPSSEWIISNMYDVITSTKYIVDTGGYIIPDVKNAKNIWKGR